MYGRWKDAQKAERRHKPLYEYASRKRQWNEYIIKPLNLLISEKMAILDVGCGIAGIIYYLDEGYRIGLDPLVQSRSDDITLIKGVGETIPVASNLFDIVFCINVLDHSSNPINVLREISRVLKPNGRLVIQLNTFDFVNKRLFSFREHFNFFRDVEHPFHFTSYDVFSLVRDSGFSITSTMYDGDGVYNSYKEIKGKPLVTKLMFALQFRLFRILPKSFSKGIRIVALRKSS